MSYVLTFCIGVLLGIVIAACLAIGGDSERMEEAYNKGIEEGKRIAMNESK